MRHDGIHGKNYRAIGGFSFCHDFTRCIGQIFFNQRFAHLISLGKQKCVGHGTANDERFNFFHQVAEQIKLRRHFGSTDNRNYGALWGFERCAQSFQFSFHGAASVSRNQMRNAFRRRMRAVGR